MKVAVPFTKNILAPLGIADAASAIDVGIDVGIHGKINYMVLVQQI